MNKHLQVSDLMANTAADHDKEASRLYGELSDDTPELNKIYWSRINWHVHQSYKKSWQK